MRTTLEILALACVMSLALLSCAAIEKDTVMDTERLLSASGFQMRMADTPQKLEKIKMMSQRKLIRHQDNGKTNYVYADATYCKCVYAGTEKAYNKFKELSADRLAMDAMSARDENIRMDWEVWGGDPGSAWQYWD